MTEEYEAHLKELEKLQKDRDLKKETLFRFFLESQAVGHACPELIRAQYGSDHSMSGDCRYCFYGRMSKEEKTNLAHALQNAWADSEHKLQSAMATTRRKV